jgi:hypothetical protein
LFLEPSHVPPPPRLDNIRRVKLTQGVTSLISNPPSVRSRGDGEEEEEEEEEEEKTASRLHLAFAIARKSRAE